MKRLKILLWLVGVTILYLLLIGCKTQTNVNCDAYGKVKILKVPYSDTIVMESLHYHLDEEQLCCWVPKDTNVYKDTLYIELRYD